MLHKDAVIKIKTQTGEITSGVVLEVAEFGVGNMWWVQYPKDGRQEVSIFNEDDLINWNTEAPCSCGSRTLGHPGHSTFCESYG